MLFECTRNKNYTIDAAFQVLVLMRKGTANFGAIGYKFIFTLKYKLPLAINNEYFWFRKTLVTLLLNYSLYLSNFVPS